MDNPYNPQQKHTQHTNKRSSSFTLWCKKLAHFMQSIFKFKTSKPLPLSLVDEEPNMSSKSTDKSQDKMLCLKNEIKKHESGMNRLIIGALADFSEDLDPEERPVLLEVEIIPVEGASFGKSSKDESDEKADPNLRITHFPPTNSLH